MRILIIEDEYIIQNYLQQLLLQHFDCETAVASTCAEAHSKIQALVPHLVLSNINLMDTCTGIELVQQWQNDFHFETIFITAYQTKAVIESAASTAPASYLLKPIDENQLLVAIELTRIRLKINTLAGTRRSCPIEKLLTKMEYQILQWIAQQYTSKEIAAKLYMSSSTIKNHRHNMSRKLDLSPSNNALTKWAIDRRHEFVDKE
jgi:DNA-binding NarL/FixJ family response regulator